MRPQAPAKARPDAPPTRKHVPGTRTETVTPLGNIPSKIQNIPSILTDVFTAVRNIPSDLTKYALSSSTSLRTRATVRRFLENLSNFVSLSIFKHFLRNWYQNEAYDI